MFSNSNIADYLIAGWSGQYADFLQTQWHHCRSLSVNNGLSGIGFFFLHRYIRYNAPEDLATLCDLLEQAVEVLETAPDQGFSLADLTEFCYFIDCVTPFMQNLFELTSLRAQLYEIITISALEKLAGESYDPYIGTFYPAYFTLQRREEDLLISACLDTLIEKSFFDEDGACFFDSRFTAGRQWLSITHGLAFYLLFLCKLMEQKRDDDRCTSLIKGYVVFLLRELNTDVSDGSLFPDFTGGDYNTRLNLCYGDAGIIWSLLKAAEVLNDQSLRWKTNALLRTTRERSSSLRTGIVDTCPLYGSAGMYLYFEHVFRFTGDKDNQLVAGCWKQYTIDHMKSEMENEVVRGNWAFHEGIMGVLTVLMAGESQMLQQLGNLYYLY